MSLASAGARPCSIARSSISGLSASITARKSFFGFALTARSAQDPQALVLPARLRACARDEQDERRDRDEADHGHGYREAGQAERNPVRVQVDQGGRAGAEPAARAREERGDGE